MSYNFYLCAGTHRWVEMEALREHLEAMGHQVVSRWHQQQGSPRLEIADPAIRDRAEECVMDIARCDVLVSFDAGEGGTNRGGRHWEAGAAFGAGKDVFHVGQLEHAFHTLADEHFEDSEMLLGYVREELTEVRT